MSAKRATPRASPATTSSGSPSPWPPSPRRWRPRLPGALANGPPPQQPREEDEPGDQRPAPLPGFHFDLRPGVPVDLPGEIIDAVREGQARLEQTKESQRLALGLPPRPGARRSLAPPFRQHRRADPPVALKVALDERGRLAPPLGAKLGRVGQREAGAEHG